MLVAARLSYRRRSPGGRYDEPIVQLEVTKGFGKAARVGRWQGFSEWNRNGVGTAIEQEMGQRFVKSTRIGPCNGNPDSQPGIAPSSIPTSVYPSTVALIAGAFRIFPAEIQDVHTRILLRSPRSSTIFAD